MRGVVSICLVVLVAGVVRAGAGEAAAKDLRQFYQMNCAGCHGPDGAAKDAQGKSLKGADFTEAGWGQRTDDAAMAKTILGGKFFGLAMPAYKKQLSQEEAQRLVREVLRKAALGRAIAAAPAGAESKQP